MDNDTLAVEADGKFGLLREDNLHLAMTNYLNKYYSDMRWLVKMYTVPTKVYPLIQDFRGEKFSFLNFLNNGTSILVYGAPMHEYFYGMYDAEFYHEFCERKIEVDRTSLYKLKEEDPQPMLFGMVREAIVT